MGNFYIGGEYTGCHSMSRESFDIAMIGAEVADCAIRREAVPDHEVFILNDKT